MTWMSRRTVTSPLCACLQGLEPGVVVTVRLTAQAIQSPSLLNIKSRSAQPPRGDDQARSKIID